MDRSVETIIEANPNMKPGDVYLLNAPYNGGTHLPDITVITPVFVADKPLFFVATRGHHADVGGITPGSVPPDSTIDVKLFVTMPKVHAVSPSQMIQIKAADLLGLNRNTLRKKIRAHAIEIVKQSRRQG